MICMFSIPTGLFTSPISSPQQNQSLRGTEEFPDQVEQKIGIAVGMSTIEFERVGKQAAGVGRSPVNLPTNPNQVGLRRGTGH